MINAYTALPEIYDTLMYDVDYHAWAAYIDSFLSEIRPRKIIEACCGTGNITLRLIRKGYQVTPFDLSDEMLRIAQQKARKSGKKITFLKQDMREMDLPVHDALVCACDGVNYLSTEDDLLQFFKAAYKCIKPSGYFLFDMSSLYKMEHILGNELFFEDRDELSFFWQNKLEKEKNQVELSITFFIRDVDGKYTREDETQIQYFYPAEIILSLLKEAGFVKADAYGFMTRELPAENADRIQFCAKK